MFVYLCMYVCMHVHMPACFVFLKVLVHVCMCFYDATFAVLMQFKYKKRIYKTQYNPTKLKKLHSSVSRFRLVFLHFSLSAFSVFLQGLILQCFFCESLVYLRYLHCFFSVFSLFLQRIVTVSFVCLQFIFIASAIIVSSVIFGIRGAHPMGGMKQKSSSLSF